MSRTRGSSLVSSLGITVALVCLLAGIAAAQSTYSVTYYSNPNPTKWDSTFHIVNPGAAVTSINLDGQPLNGNLCAEIYVYNDDEQVVECCGCLLTPDSEKTLSLNKDLLANPVNSLEVTTDGVVKIISALPNSAGKCDPTGDTTIVPTLELQNWASHVQATATNPETEEEFANATLSSLELEYDERLCSAINTSGSKKGICSCGYGD